jgi:hypothetical protein
MIALFANLALIMNPIYQWLLVAQLAALVVACWAYRLKPGQSVPKFLKPITYFYLMNYALLCGFFRFLFRTQRVTWDRASR